MAKGKAKIQSVEPMVADLVNGWLKSYGLDYKLEQEPLNSAIDKALSEYASKNGGTGGNRPDVKLLHKDRQGRYWPILIEYKGYKDKLEKLDKDGKIENIKANNEPNYTNINSFAVNGAIHYANALLHYTNYSNIISIGVTGYKDKFGVLQTQIGVYFVSKDNLGIGQKIDEYTDLSFLKLSNFNDFVKKIKELELSPDELEKLKEQRENEIDASLIKLNNDIYEKESGLAENDRVYLVAASIMATLGVENEVSPLTKEELLSKEEFQNTDGDIILRKVTAFLNAKKSLILKKE